VLIVHACRRRMHYPPLHPWCDLLAADSHRADLEARLVATPMRARQSAGFHPRMLAATVKTTSFRAFSVSYYPRAVCVSVCGS